MSNSATYSITEVAQRIFSEFPATDECINRLITEIHHHTEIPEIRKSIKGIAGALKSGSPAITGRSTLTSTNVSGPIWLHNVYMANCLVMGCGGIALPAMKQIRSGSIIVVINGDVLTSIHQVNMQTIGIWDGWDDPKYDTADTRLQSNRSRQDMN